MEQVEKNNVIGERSKLRSLFTATFGRPISRDTIRRIIRKNIPNKRLRICLGAVEKYWIVEHAEKYKHLTSERLARIFTAEFGRPIAPGTIISIRGLRAKTLKMFASWAQNNSVEIKSQEADCITEPNRGRHRDASRDRDPGFIPSHCQSLVPNEEVYLTIPAKYWIVEQAEKKQDLTAVQLAGEFTAKFCRPKPAETIMRILNQKKEIRHEFASWAENFELELVCLTNDQKDWIVEYSEKNKDMTLGRLAHEFTVEFRRPVSWKSIYEILKESNEKVQIDSKTIVAPNVSNVTNVGNVSREPVLQKFVSSIPPRKKDGTIRKRTIGGLLKRTLLPKLL